jgi:hypothetical protein
MRKNIKLRLQFMDPVNKEMNEFYRSKDYNNDFCRTIGETKVTETIILKAPGGPKNN